MAGNLTGTIADGPVANDFILVPRLVRTVSRVSNLKRFFDFLHNYSPKILGPPGRATSAGVSTDFEL